MPFSLNLVEICIGYTGLGAPSKRARPALLFSVGSKGFGQFARECYGVAVSENKQHLGGRSQGAGV